MSKAAMVAGMKVMYELSNMDFHSPRVNWLCSRLSDQFASTSSRDQHWIPISAAFPQSEQVDHIETLLSKKVECFVFTRIDTYSGCKFVFPACNASIKTVIFGFTEFHIHSHSISHRIASEQRTHFIANEVWQWAHDDGIYWSYLVSHYPEEDDLTEWWKDLFKTQLQPTGWQCLVELGQDFWEGCICSDLASNIQGCFSYCYKMTALEELGKISWAKMCH